MDYFNDVFNTFLGLERGSSFAVYAGYMKVLGFHQKYLCIKCVCVVILVSNDIVVMSMPIFSYS